MLTPVRAVGAATAIWTPERRRDLAVRLAALPPAEQALVLAEAVENADRLLKGARAERDRLRAGLARLRKTSCADCDAAEVAHNILAADAEGGEDRD